MTEANSWQPELVLDVCAQVPQQDNACGLIVLQYHLILGTMLDKRPDLFTVRSVGMTTVTR